MTQSDRSQFTGIAGVPFELTFTTGTGQREPDQFVEAYLQVQAPDYSLRRTPLFWDGDDLFRARFCPHQTGVHRFQLIAHGVGTRWTGPTAGKLLVEPYTGENPLFRHGAISVNPGSRHFTHADGTPFLWLGDTWWYGASQRCGWPQPFQDLVAQRSAQGFNVVQLVLGIPPEIGADHPSAANEGGHPFTRQWDLINPVYFQAVDQRIACLVNAGIVPCILGGWGYQIDWMGIDAMTRYWRYLVARYAAYPVVWCLSGESDMLERPHAKPDDRVKALLSRAVHRLPAVARQRLRRWKRSLPRHSADYAARLATRRQGWVSVGQSLAEVDPEHHLITTHPVPGVLAHISLKCASWVGFTGIQSGHAEAARYPMVAAILQARHETPSLPVVNLEPWYEGILGRFPAADQRYAFWMCLLAGAAGHTYGAQGLWQMAQDDGFMGHWGDADWKTALRLPGAQQLGLGASLLRTVPWWRLTSRLEALDPGWQVGGEWMPLMAGVDDELFLVYFPSGAHCRTTTWTDPPPGVGFMGVWWNPRTGEQLAGAAWASTDSRGLTLACPDDEDWLLLLRPAAANP